MNRDHRAWAEIDLAAFRHNLSEARKQAGSAELWPVLKANAYGHGARQMAHICSEVGVSKIGVGDSHEALELRESNITTPLLILGTAIDAELPLLLEHQVEVGVHSEARAHTLGKLLQGQTKRLGVHLKIDCGMGRLGVLPEAALRVAQAIMSEPSLELRGVMTHFPAPDGKLNPETEARQSIFQHAIDELASNGIQVPASHCANSAALFTDLHPLGDAVRPGIALYGILPEAVSSQHKLRPVLSLKAQIVFLKDLPEGASVGYGSRWTSHRPTRIATLPIGYNDGVPYRLGAEGRGNVLVHGKRCPIVGAVSMDYVTVDVGHVPGVQLGDVATLIGFDGEEAIYVSEVADAAGTIPYEITCSIGARVQRIWRDEPNSNLPLKQAPKVHSE